MLPNSNFNANAVGFIAPGIIRDNAAFTSNVIDLGSEAVNGAKFLVFALHLGSIDAALAVLKVMESDTQTDPTTLGGAPTEVVDGTDTVTPGAADDNKIYLVTIDLRAPRQRYLQLQLTAGDGAAGTYASGMVFAVNPHAIQANNNAAAVIAG